MDINILQVHLFLMKGTSGLYKLETFRIFHDLNSLSTHNGVWYRANQWIVFSFLPADRCASWELRQGSLKSGAVEIGLLAKSGSF